MFHDATASDFWVVMKFGRIVTPALIVNNNDLYLLGIILN